MGFNFKDLMGKITSSIDVEKIRDTALEGAKKARSMASEVADLNAAPDTIEGMKNRIALYEQKITELKTALAKAEAEAAAKPATPATPASPPSQAEQKPAAPVTPPPAAQESKPEAPNMPPPEEAPQKPAAPASDKPSDDEPSH